MSADQTCEHVLYTLTKHAGSSGNDSNCSSGGDGSYLGTLTIQDEGFHGIPLSCQANTKIVPQIRLQQLLPHPLHFSKSSYLSTTVIRLTTNKYIYAFYAMNTLKFLVIK
jgi:hypothetical protein